MGEGGIGHGLIAALEKAGIIPSERKADVVAVRQLLEKS
jgi:hypothetical protein